VRGNLGQGRGQRGVGDDEQSGHGVATNRN
jgi:hypothetical protein